MKKSRFTETPDRIDPQRSRCRDEGPGCLPQAWDQPATYYKWKSKYGGLAASELKRIKELEAENAELKQMYADLSLENDALKDLIEKKL